MITNASDAKQELLSVLRFRLSRPEISDESKGVIKRFIRDAIKGDITSFDWKLLVETVTGTIDFPIGDNSRTALF